MLFRSEMSVLNGAERALKQVSAVMLEALFENLYAGQADFAEVVAFMAARGFRFFEFADQRRLPPLGQLVYADAVFIRRELRFRSAP